MNIALVAATPFEIAPVLAFLEKNFNTTEQGLFIKDALSIRPIITGVGIPPTLFSLATVFATWRPDLAINAGIAGSYDANLPIGTVVQVVTERFGDLGVEEADGRFTDLFDLGMLDRNDTPYINGVLHNPLAGGFVFLPKAKGLTVNKVHGQADTIAATKSKFADAQVESMEGAAFFYACLQSDVRFIQIRSISNRVEPRNRANWDLPLAIGNLNVVLEELLTALI